MITGGLKATSASRTWSVARWLARRSVHRPCRRGAATARRVYARVRSNEEGCAARRSSVGLARPAAGRRRAAAEILCLATNAVDLRLYVNGVGPTGGPAIAKVLDALPKLVQVDLQQWQVGPEGAKPIADAMLKHPRLKSLKMYYNKLGREAPRSSPPPRRRARLSRTSTSARTTSAPTARAVLSAVMANPGITRLSLKKNGFDYEHETKAALMRIAAGRTPPVKLLLEDPNQLPESGSSQRRADAVRGSAIAKTGDWAMDGPQGLQGRAAEPALEQGPHRPSALNAVAYALANLEVTLTLTVFLAPLAL